MLSQRGKVAVCRAIGATVVAGKSLHPNLFHMLDVCCHMHDHEFDAHGKVRRQREGKAFRERTQHLTDKSGWDLMRTTSSPAAPSRSSSRDSAGEQPGSAAPEPEADSFESAVRRSRSRLDSRPGLDLEADLDALDMGSPIEFVELLGSLRDDEAHVVLGVLVLAIVIEGRVRENLGRECGREWRLLSGLVGTHRPHLCAVRACVGGGCGRDLQCGGSAPNPHWSQSQTVSPNHPLPLHVGEPPRVSPLCHRRHHD